MSRLAYVIGQPISHSLSPPMHNAAFAACGIDAEYCAVELGADELGAWVTSVRGSDVLGFNVTIPHKERIIPLLDAIEGDAAVCRAVNTVYRTSNGRLIGTNTDTVGFRRSLRDEAGTSLGGQQVVLLGAGGAARAIAVVALQDKAARLVVANRHIERAQQLLADLDPLAGDTRVQAIALGDAGLSRATAAADVLINATSVGLRSTEVPIDPELVRPGSLVVDIVYNPLETELLAGARRRGARGLGGLGMLVFQAAGAFERWTGWPAPVEAMRCAAESVLLGTH